MTSAPACWRVRAPATSAGVGSSPIPTIAGERSGIFGLLSMMTRRCSWSVLAGVSRKSFSKKSSVAQGPIPPSTPIVLCVIIRSVRCDVESVHSFGSLGGSPAARGYRQGRGFQTDPYLRAVELDLVRELGMDFPDLHSQNFPFNICPMNTQNRRQSPIVTELNAVFHSEPRGFSQGLDLMDELPGLPL